MTIGTTISQISVEGNGVTTAFSYPFLIPDASDAVVTLTNPDGSSAVLTASQFTITGIGVPAGGTVIYPMSGSPIASGSILTIARVLPYIQGTSVSSQGPTFAAIEGALDNLEMQLQQIVSLSARAIVVNPADILDPTPLPIASVRANQFLIFDGNGNPTVGAPIATGAIVSAAMAPVIKAATLSSGIATLFGSSPMAPIIEASSPQVAFALMATQPVSANFFQNMGATIDRLNDRVFVGGATVNDGNFPNVVQDWLTAIITNVEPTVELSQVAVLSTIGGIAVLGGSQSKDNGTAGSEGTIGISGFAINNNTTLVQTVYGAYFEARAQPGIPSTSTTQGVEIDVANLTGNVVSVQPYQPYIQGAVYGLFSSSGAGIGSGLSAASLGLLIGNNGSNFDKGIMFGATAIAGTDGVTGAGVAIALARGHAITWYTPGGEEAGFINSTTSTSTPAVTSMQFTDTGLMFLNSTGENLLGVNPVAPASGASSMFLLVNNNGGVNNVNVTLGAPDSAGTGFRTLRVPN